MQQPRLRFIGVELYFEDLETAKQFYSNTLDLQISDEQVGHHAKFEAGSSFVCLERKGSESYPSRDKAGLFFEVADLSALVDAIGKHKIVHCEANSSGRLTWAVIHDPEGHNILFLQSRNE